MKCHKSPTGLLSMVKSWLGVDFMETAWDGHEMRECRLVPSVGSPFRSTGVEKWQHKHTQDSGAAAASAFLSCSYLQIL